MCFVFLSSLLLFIFLLTYYIYIYIYVANVYSLFLYVCLERCSKSAHRSKPNWSSLRNFLYFVFYLSTLSHNHIYVLYKQRLAAKFQVQSLWCWSKKRKKTKTSYMYYMLFDLAIKRIFRVFCVVSFTLEFANGSTSLSASEEWKADKSFTAIFIKTPTEPETT